MHLGPPRSCDLLTARPGNIDKCRVSEGSAHGSCFTAVTTLDVIRLSDMTHAHRIHLDIDMKRYTRDA